MQVGCGTAVPSLYLLSRLFASDLKNDGVKTQTHLQDYNASVLELVTLPNIILAWCTFTPSLRAIRLPDILIDMSPSSESYRNLQSLDSVAAFDPSSPGELQLSPALKVAFLESLHTHGIALRFYAGSWDTFNLDHAGGKYDLVLSSETIYRTESLNSLIGLMEGACGCGRGRSEIPLDELTSSRLSLAQRPPRYLCLVAAKLLYFGVGGGISEFVCAIEKLGHGRVEVETVWERKVGVGRRVLRIEWGK
jgi:protein-histidine N-methyltransferase